MIRLLFGYSGNFTDNSICDFYNLSTVLTQAITPYASILCDYRNLARFYSTAVKLWKVKENFPRHPPRH